MRLVTFLDSQTDSTLPRAGALLASGDVLDFARASGVANVPALEWFDLDKPWLERARHVVAAASGEVADRMRSDGALLSRDAVRLLAPVPRPGKVLCIGLNYRDHAAESKMEIPKSPIIFSKFVTAVTAHYAPVIIPSSSEKVDYEAELAVVIGRRAKRVAREQAYEYVLGYTNFNDVSARDFQFADGQWQRGKSCDTFGPFGPAIVTRDEVPDPHRLGIRLRLNGETMQDSSTSQLIFGVDELVAFISDTVTLEPGDVIATGTPPGVGFARKPPRFLKPGDRMEVEIEGLGVLVNPVEAESGA